ncbi:MAG: B12-binding domain-containing radical SAM protein, partial [Planctomycetaceae bacterium]|nr:B12-binding domain-containing radical SAM protein [Planctomycetaceae bacterium]
LRFVGEPEPAEIIGVSCMANLLPFTILALEQLRNKYPDRILILGGVGSKSVEEKLLQRFPWIDIICRGEAELTGPELLRTLKSHGKTALENVAGVSFRNSSGDIVHTPNQQRIRRLDEIPFPAFHKVDLSRYAGYGMMSSRGCPYPCTFCSVAPVWNLESYSRSPHNIVDEMQYLHERAGVELFLFQDEFFVSGKRQVMEFCRELTKRKLAVKWKAFGRVNLVDEEMMQAMSDTGCVELRFGVESGSDKVLQAIKKGFTTAEVLQRIPEAIKYFPRVDVFYVWGFPFETIEDFQQSLFQMVSLRMMGARILPSLLSLLPQTEIFREWSSKQELEFCSFLLPEFVFTGHEICRNGKIELPEKHRDYFDLILRNADLFPGFYHIDLANNVLPKLEMLRQFGFYPETKEPESCGAHSPGRDFATTSKT